MQRNVANSEKKRNTLTEGMEAAGWTKLRMKVEEGSVRDLMRAARKEAAAMKVEEDGGKSEKK